MLVLSWLLLAPVGSALAFDDIPNLQRTVFMTPVLSIFSAIGFVALWKSKLRYLLLIVSLYCVGFFLHQYFIHLPIHKPWYRHEGYEQLVSSVNKFLPSYQKAVITDRESAPAIFFLFFGRYDPETYLKETAGRAIHDYDRANFGPYEFSQEECPLRIDSKTSLLTGQVNVVYVNYATCVTPQSTNELESISRGDQSTVFRILTK